MYAGPLSTGTWCGTSLGSSCRHTCPSSHSGPSHEHTPSSARCPSRPHTLTHTHTHTHTDTHTHKPSCKTYTQHTHALKLYRMSYNLIHSPSPSPYDHVTVTLRSCDCVPGSHDPAAALGAAESGTALGQQSDGSEGPPLPHMAGKIPRPRTTPWPRPSSAETRF